MWNTHCYRFWSSTKKISWWEYVAWGVRNLKSTMPSRGVERSRSTLTPAFLPQLYRKIHERKRFHRRPSRVSSIAKGSSWIWFWRRETHVSFRLALRLITIPLAHSIPSKLWCQKQWFVGYWKNTISRNSERSSHKLCPDGWFCRIAHESKIG